MKLTEYELDLLSHSLEADGNRDRYYEASKDTLKLATSLNKYAIGLTTERNLARDIGGLFVELNRLVLTMEEPWLVQININRRISQVRETYLEAQGVAQ
jgi:hypothetical protein